MAVVTFFHASPGKVTVQVRARRLPPGCHGFHVHAIGVCDPATGFTSAGGHVNPTGGAHDDHAATVAIDRFSIDQLLDADGSAMVVHAAADNYANIPTRYHSHDFLVLSKASRSQCWLRISPRRRNVPRNAPSLFGSRKGLTLAHMQPDPPAMMHIRRGPAGRRLL